jgi:hypothetical protein
MSFEPLRPGDLAMIRGTGRVVRIVRVTSSARGGYAVVAKRVGAAGSFNTDVHPLSNLLPLGEALLQNLLHARKAAKEMDRYDLVERLTDLMEDAERAIRLGIDGPSEVRAETVADLFPPDVVRNLADQAAQGACDPEAHIVRGWD